MQKSRVLKEHAFLHSEFCILNCAVTCSFVILALLAVPSTAAAQKEPFFDALLPLYKALAGAYGDEGHQLTAHLASMSDALARWDAATRDAEAELRVRSRTADPQTALRARTLLASIYLDRSRFTEALREFDAGIRIDPRRAAFHRFKALIHQALGRRADAAAAFRAAWMIDPWDPLHAYQLIVHRSPQTTAVQQARARDTLAMLERELVHGGRAKAVSPFLSLRAIDDDAAGAMAFAPAAYTHAFSLLLKGDLDAGLTALRDAVSTDPLVSDAAVRLEPVTRGVAALREGQIAQAVDSLNAAFALAPDSSEVRRLLATAEYISGDVAASLQHLRDAVRLNPQNERAWLALARTLDDLGEWVDAADVLRKALAALPESGELRWQLSVMSGKRQRTDTADLELIAAADRQVLLAGTGEFYGRVARLAQAHLDYERAVVLLEQRVALTPNNAAAHQALGRAYVDLGREEEGYSELVMALLLEPADAETLTALGRLHLGAGRYPSGIEALTRAVTLAPASPESVHALGETLTRAGRPDEGRPHLAEAELLRGRAVETQRRSRTAGMLALEAELHMSNGDYERAIETWQQVIEHEGRSAANHLRLAAALVAAKRLDEAAAQLQMAISANAGADAHRRLADVYAALGRADDSGRERRTYTEQRLKELRERAGE
jgi:tetratricopeptide (TPR) repeat protein